MALLCSQSIRRRRARTCAAGALAVTALLSGVFLTRPALAQTPKRAPDEGASVLIDVDVQDPWKENSLSKRRIFFLMFCNKILVIFEF